MIAYALTPSMDSHCLQPGSTVLRGSHFQHSIPHQRSFAPVQCGVLFVIQVIDVRVSWLQPFFRCTLSQGSPPHSRAFSNLVSELTPMPHYLTVCFLPNMFGRIPNPQIYLTSFLHPNYTCFKLKFCRLGSWLCVERYLSS